MNESDFYTVEWIIDTRPNYNLTDNYIEFNEFVYPTQNNINNTIELPREDDFIPFDSKKFQRISIESKVCKFPLSEEERNCPICYETKECKDISAINCRHKFCGTCIIDHVSINYTNPCCPLCREKIHCITFQRHFYEDDFKNL
jgi:hypothetical protein